MRSSKHAVLFALTLHLLFTMVASEASARSNFITHQRAPKNDINSEVELFHALDSSPTASLNNIQVCSLGPNIVTERVWRWLSTKSSWYATQRDTLNALRLCRAAVTVSTCLKDKRLLGMSHFRQGRLLAGADLLSEALTAYSQAERYFAEVSQLCDVAASSYYKSVTYLSMRDWDRAQEAATRAIKVGSSIEDNLALRAQFVIGKSTAGSHEILGMLALRAGNIGEAISNYSLTLDIYSILDDNSHGFGRETVDASVRLAELLYSVGNARSSLTLLSRALALARARHLYKEVADILRSLGSLYLDQERYDSSRTFYNECLAISKARGFGNERIAALLGLGLVTTNLGDHSVAESYFRRGLELANVAKNRDSILLARQGIARTYVHRNNSRGALIHLRIAEKLAQEVSDLARLGEVYWQQAEIQKTMHDPASSIHLAQKALRIANRLNYSRLAESVSILLAELFIRSARPDLASATLTQYADRFEREREGTIGDIQSKMQVPQRLSAHSLLVDLLSADGKAQEALNVADRAKARLLYDIVRNGRAKASDVLNDLELIEQKRLNLDLSDIRQTLRFEQAKPQPSKSRIALLHAKLEEARLRYASFRDLLLVSHPELRAKSAVPTPITPESLSRLLPDEKTAILEYMVTDAKVISFLVRRNAAEQEPQVNIYISNISKDELSKRVSDLRDAFAERLPGYVGPARSLHDLLIGPWEANLKGIDTLCIIPDELLWEVPFQALQSSDGRFLIERLSLHYSPSISVLAETNARAKRFDSPLLAFGNPVAEREALKQARELHTDLRFDPIPESEAEVQTIGRLFEPDKRAIFVGSEATESLLKSRGRNFGVIHLATHGVLDNLNPLYSYLILAKNGSEDDGLLETREVMDLDLNADLVVLSACETARGKIGAGEGVIGMSWAFFAAGCRTTLVSQWKVNSESTSRLMATFYDELSKGQNKTHALRVATLEIARHPGYRHPFYWAPFILVGSSH